MEELLDGTQISTGVCILWQWDSYLRSGVVIGKISQRRSRNRRSSRGGSVNPGRRTRQEEDSGVFSSLTLLLPRLSSRCRSGNRSSYRGFHINEFEAIQLGPTVSEFMRGNDRRTH